jgi:hypothetical protein
MDISCMEEAQASSWSLANIVSRLEVSSPIADEEVTFEYIVAKANKSNGETK